ncbi:MAG: hypothetical protein AB2A00_25530 [Myxococcota bacterium]
MSTPSNLSRDDVAGALSQSLGKAKADELVSRVATELGLPAGALTVPQALSILEHIAQQPGIVGVTARFAKSRMVLRWGGGTNPQ